MLESIGAHVVATKPRGQRKKVRRVDVDTDEPLQPATSVVFLVTAFGAS
jgi:hypothetical protein